MSFKKVLEEKRNSGNFDIVVGNPPYNNRLYKQVVSKALEVTGNYLLLVIPCNFMIQVSSGDFKDSIINHKLCCINFLPQDIFAGIKVATLYFLLDLNKTKSDIVVNDDIIIYDTSMIRDYKSKEEISIFDKIKDRKKLVLYTGKNETVKFHENYGNPRLLEGISEEKDDKHPYKMLSRLGGGETKHYWISKPKDMKAISKGYLVLPVGTASYNNISSIKNISKPLVYAEYLSPYIHMSTALVGLPVQSEDEAEVLRWYFLESIFVRFLFLRLNLPFSKITPGFIHNIPSIPLDGSISTDEDVYDYFDFTDQEINLINTEVCE